MLLKNNVIPEFIRYVARYSGINTVLDMGCGNGSTGQSLKERFKHIIIDGCEIYPKYIEKAYSRKAGSEPVYRNIIIGDLRKLEYKYEDYDLFLLIDVLNCMSQEDGLKVLNRYKSKLFVSITYGEWGATGVKDNPFEEHVYKWTHAEIMEVARMCLYKSAAVGIYKV